MTTPQNQTVEVKLKVVNDGSGVKVMNTLTGAITAAAKAEDRLAESARKRGQVQRQTAASAAGVYGIKDEWGGLRDTYRLAPAGAVTAAETTAAVPAWLARQHAMQQAIAQKAEAQRQEEQAARRQRVLGGLGAQRQRELAHHEAVGQYDDLAGDMAANYARRRKAVQELHARGLNDDGSRRFRFDNWLDSSAQDRTGLDAAGAFSRRLVGRAAVPLALLYGGQQAAAATYRADQIANTPFQRAGSVNELQNRANPIIGSFYSAWYDTRRIKSGETDQIRLAEERGLTLPMRAALTGQVSLTEQQYRAEQQALRNRADAFQTFRLDRRTGTDDTTVRGQQQYDRESRLLPLRREQTRAARELAAAEKTLTDAEKTQAQRKTELIDLEKRLNAARFSRQKAEGVDTREAGSTAGYLNAANRESELNQQYENKRQQLLEAQNRTRQAQGEVGQRQADKGRADAALTRGQLADVNDRLADARAGARDLAGRGIGGRQEAKVALEAVMRLGPNGVSPDMLALAESVAPETVGKLKERFGEAEKAEFRKIAPDERRFQPAAPLRAERDRLEEKGLRQEERTTTQEFRAAAEAHQRELFEIITGMYRGLEQQLKQFTADRTRAAGNARVGG